jgi:tetratricopeptide (TPR) repeat protein
MVALHKAGPVAVAGDLLDRSTARNLFAEAVPVVRLDGATATPETVAAAVDGLPDRGIVVIDGVLGADLVADLTARFVAVDHREIAVHFRDAVVHPQAKLVYAVERHRDGAVLVKAPNDYPSNFFFDPTQPQAAVAMAQMRATLAEGEDEPGLINLASMVTMQEGREAAGPILARLDAMGSRARVYFELHASLAQKMKDNDRAAMLYRAALDSFPDDPGFVTGLVSLQLSAGETGEARGLVDAAIAANPRHAGLQVLLMRVAGRIGDLELLREAAARAQALTPAGRRDKVLATLGELLIAAQRDAEAAPHLAAVAAGDSRFAAKAAKLLSGVAERQGDLAEARRLAERAVTLAPHQPVYRQWRDRLGA